MKPTSYTRFPRTILWLVPGSEAVGNPGCDHRAPVGEPIEPFYLSKWPITNEQIEAFDPEHLRSKLSPGDRDTALGVDLERARAYCEWYAAVSKKAMRLPTDCEWEHACRAGTTDRYFWGEDPERGDDFLQDGDNWSGVLGAADQKKANGFGLYAMLGGAWEWTDDGWLRGGSFRTPRLKICCSLRKRALDREHEDVGFRVAKSLR